jgi:hypothetical protein
LGARWFALFHDNLGDSIVYLWGSDRLRIEQIVGSPKEHLDVLQAFEDLSFVELDIVKERVEIQASCVVLLGDFQTSNNLSLY